ncbi:MAG: hypothetical protein WAU38_03520 [Ignavibacteria bacterium]
MFSVIIPAYNEESVIKSTIEELKKFLLRLNPVMRKSFLLTTGRPTKHPKLLKMQAQ